MLCLELFFTHLMNVFKCSKHVRKYLVGKHGELLVAVWSHRHCMDKFCGFLGHVGIIIIGMCISNHQDYDVLSLVFSALMPND